ncbi:Transducin/WD40 repeat-like superfamily protein [Thalictrum thalictroides]|uniref:Transducin/WD40 repeat-like superfamily protein n=1 Tax=Thalictrum thalictroides TaxID=46969 RepID=A0A7J6V8S7_THATH|nr:Transducin/WD40 repeat-like superfamily protein [Thalictrum thalictroides]
MSHTSMEVYHSKPVYLDSEKLDFQFIRVFVVQVNQYILKFLEDPETRNSLRQRCTSKLQIQKQEFFEFSEHSVLSNLYWGIESIEAAIQAKWPEEKISRLKSSERMLQVPALIQEHGSTGGIQNNYLISCSYFYLSLVRKLQRDDWQVTLHFLHAMLIHPRLVRTDFMPELWENVILPQLMSRKLQSRLGELQSESRVDFFDSAFDEPTKQLARRYKDRLMYCQVMLYGDNPHWNLGERIAQLDEESQSFTYSTSTSSESTDSTDHGNGWPQFQDCEKVHPLDIQGSRTEKFTGASACIVTCQIESTAPQDDGKALHDKLNEFHNSDAKATSAVKSLQEMLKESQSDTPVSSCSYDSPDGSPSNMEKSNSSEKSADKIEGFGSRLSTTEADKSQPEISHRLQSTCSISKPECIKLKSPEATEYLMQKDDYEVYTSYFFPGRILSSISDLKLPSLKTGDIGSDTVSKHVEGTNLRRPEKSDFRLFDHSRSMNNYSFIHKDRRGNSARRSQDLVRRKRLSKTNVHSEKDEPIEMMQIFEHAISKLCFSELVGQCEENIVEVSVIWEVLNNKSEARYSLLKDEILDRLLNAISTSQEENIIRASVFILTTIISKNKAVIEDIKRRGLRLCDLASALKRNVHEAAILIYMVNPSPKEIKALELLPALLDVACTSNRGVPISIQLTPLAASLMIIEVLVTAFDFTTNSMHLAAISSASVVTRLANAAADKNTEEIISLAAILIKCMQYDGKCKKILSQFTSMGPFIRLLRSNEKTAKITGLRFFHEILQMPRSSAIRLLHQIQEADSLNTTHALMSSIQNLEPEHQILASNLLLQLDMLEDSSGTSLFRDEAMEVLLKAITSEESSEQQVFSASILSNIGGTYAWTGEPYTAAWLVKRIGLTSKHHSNMIRNFDWSDQSLHDGGIDAWCSKVAQNFITIGNPIFCALEKGLQSKTRCVSRDCLITVAWLGCEIAKMSSSDIRYSACQILLSGIEQFLHPGVDLDERLLACLSVYNYASGEGMQKLMHFSEGVQESLRRLSSITWIADELLKVTEYFLPAKSRVSCVHTQILEAGYNCGVAACALIYYKGHLYSGYSDGSIKVWAIEGQTAMLVRDVKEHKKAVTCFTLSEPGDSLVSGSADSTIRVWQMVQRRLECVEVIGAKEPVHKLESYKQFIFVVTKSRGVKVFDTSRKVKSICKNKHVKCMAIVQGKLYLGCTDSSIQEVDIKNERDQEIKAPSKRWWKQNKPVTAILGYKEWFYSASIHVEGSVLKERSKHKEPQMSISMEKGKYVQAMGVVEDFVYLTCSLSSNTIEIWLRGTQRKVGRLSAGSKITCLLTANDMVICGTDTGLIKGWIPL